MFYPVPLFWLPMYLNPPCYLILGHYTVSKKCRLYLWGQSKAFSVSHIYSWVFTIPCTMGSPLFVGLYLPLIFFIPFSMLVGWMFHVHIIKFPFRILLGTPPPILAISGNLFLWFFYSSKFKISKSLNITLVGVAYFSVGSGLGSVNSSSWNVSRGDPIVQGMVKNQL